MSLPTRTDLLTLNYSFLGQPFCNIPAKLNMNTTTLNYSFLGQPFVTNPDPATGPNSLSAVFGVLLKTNIKDINGIAIALFKDNI